MEKKTLSIKAIFGLAAAAAVLLCSSCATAELAYISDAQRDSAQAIVNNYVSSIHPGDQLYIYVSSQTIESTILFNEETIKSAASVTGRGATARTQTGSSSGLSGYTVNQDGCILFPVLGRINTTGMTKDSLAAHIEQRLLNEGYINDAKVTVSSMNFRVSVLGEVVRPQEIHIPGDRLTIFEALAYCGDLTIYGQRENILVLRENSGNATPVSLNLTDKSILDSPYYYLQSNDIVYVEPNNMKKKTATRDTDVPKYVAIGVKLIHIIATGTRTASILAK